jgi:hypothetical protein
MVPVRKRGRTLGSLLERFKKNPKGKHPAEESVLGRTIPPHQRCPHPNLQTSHDKRDFVNIRDTEMGRLSWSISGSNANTRSSEEEGVLCS